ncbi:MAG: hypothetical protein ACI9C4_001702 [Paraglaciecola sp.]|jgi:hypothetical protein
MSLIAEPVYALLSTSAVPELSGAIAAPVLTYFTNIWF